MSPEQNSISKQHDELIIQFNNITKKYGKFTALENASFQIEKGEVFGYIGTNGAGKTTTIKILVGLIQKYSGNYSLNGFEMPHEYSKVQKYFGYMPQDVAFQEWRTVDHALKTFGKLSGLDDNALERKIPPILELLELSEFRHKKIKQLSGGMTQKVGFAQAILHSPKFLVLDEPLSGLDPASRHSVKEILRDLRAKGTTIFFSSHILSDVQDIATRIGIISKGRIIRIGTFEELKAHLHKTEEVEIVFSNPNADRQPLSAIAGVDLVKEKIPGTLLLSLKEGTSADEVIYQAIKLLLQSDCRIRSIGPVIPDLDEIYMKYIKGENESES